VDAGVEAPKPVVKPVLMTPAIINRVLKKDAGVFECIQRFSPMLPDAKGTILVKCDIQRSGAVTAVELKTPGLGKALEDCMVRQVGRLKFPRNLGFPEGKKNTVILPFTYGLR
jgi:hypothetical protein